MSNSLIKRLQRHLESTQATIERFKEKLNEDPHHALSWSLDAFHASSKAWVLKDCINHLERGVSAKDLKQILVGVVINKGRYPAQSTSPTSNLIEQYDLAAASEIVSDLEYFIE